MDRHEKKLRIGILLRNRHDGPGGLEKVLEVLNRSMVTDEAELYFYAHFPPQYTEFTRDFARLNVLKLPRLIERTTSLMPKSIRRIIHKGYVKGFGGKLFDQMIHDQIDVLITMDLSKQFLKNYADLKRFKETTNTPLLSWVHSSLFDDNEQVIATVRKKIDLFDGHLAISNGIRQELINLYDVEENVRVVYNPIHSADIIKRDPRKFVYIGRIDKNKRVDSLLKQLKKLKGQWTLDVYGTTGSIKKDRLFQDSIERLGLADKVIFHGWKNGVWEHIQSMGALLLNSKNEGFGLVLAEAMMRGIPIVSANCSGAEELVEHNQNGWLYPMDDEEQLWGILQAILNEDLILPDPQQIQASVKHFETAQYIDNFLDQINNLISKP